jgi:predicted RNase H-like HicB family nuclease
MRNEFTAVIERDGDWYIGYSPEVPGANGQGRTVEECRASLADAIALILEDRREDGLRGVPNEANRVVATSPPKRVRSQARGTRPFALDQSPNRRD